MRAGEGNAAARHIPHTRGIGGAFAELGDDHGQRRGRCRIGRPDLRRRAGHREAADQADCDGKHVRCHRQAELQAAMSRKIHAKP